MAVNANTHLVQKGETLSGIASKNGTTYKKLAAINNIKNPDLIYVGQEIKLTEDATTSKKKVSPSKATIDHFGLLATSDNTLFATWSWDMKDTEKYQVKWEYASNGLWFVGSSTAITVDENDPDSSKQSTYSIPSGATQVRFRVKPIAKSETTNGSSSASWTASWSSAKKFNVSNIPPAAPSNLGVSYKDHKLTASLTGLETGLKTIEFRVVKNNASTYSTGKATVTYPISGGNGNASYTWTVEDGNEYTVCCRASNGTVTSDWSAYSSSIGTPPAKPNSVTSLKALSETAVHIEWEPVSNAVTYKIEYTTKKIYFDSSNDVSSTSVDASLVNHAEITGLETGTEYFFRVRAENEHGSSSWTDISSVTIGKKPAAPTTWSSTTTATVGEPLNLYWVHNSEDGSSQTYADLEIIYNGVTETYTIQNSTEEEEKNKTSVYPIDTAEYPDGAQIQWRVRTAGITKVYGDWSMQRTVDIYAPPTMELSVTDNAGEWLETLESFPFHIRALAGPNTQAPIGFHVTITANESYETIDNVGNATYINSGDSVYSRYFDTTDNPLEVTLSAADLNLDNNIGYTITCVASMNSGLTASGSLEFDVSWTDVEYEPNAEIVVDEESYVAHIRPYCEIRTLTLYKVNVSGTTYTVTNEEVISAFGSVVNGIVTTTGEQVYLGTDSNGTSIYYCQVENRTVVEDASLSVYRREFDGTFTELATGLDNAVGTFVTDPHPALDYARYRIVAITNSTGAVSYYDVPGHPVNCKAVIIQWAEEWSNFDISNEDELAEPAWAGSLLKLPYNIDVSDGHKPDVALVEYIGRSRPVSYYGTQLGETATWNVTIAKDDKETLYALRRLSIWMGDVYVREPSGSGYWANVTVSFSQKHTDKTIPVTLSISRVEGGI